jgi:hypothetical protein
MAEDLKAATPDTSFAWATAGLFGADSQAAASPSYFPASNVRTALLALASTWTADGAVSTPAKLLSGTWFTGGSATTTKPQLLVEPAGTTSTGWDTAGTGFGINAPSGFTGKSVDVQIAGVTKFSIRASDGQLINQGACLFNNAQVAIGATGSGDVAMRQTGQLVWSSTNAANGGTDTVLARESAGFMGSPGSLRIMNATAIPAGGAAAAGYKFSSTANFGFFFGSGTPTLSAAKGSMYLRSDGSIASDRAYINTDGGTTWTALITAA